MVSVEQLYKNFAILADAKDKAGEVHTPLCIEIVSIFRCCMREMVGGVISRVKTPHFCIFMFTCDCQSVYAAIHPCPDTNLGA